jgi:DNA-directed RNA polymerase alpha subunit
LTKPPQALLDLLSIARDAQCDERFNRAEEILRQAVAAYAPTALPIEILCPMPVRMANGLCNAGVETVADLLRRNPADLRKWKNFGQVSLSIIGMRMRALGLNLAEQHDYTWIKPLPARHRERSLLIPATWTWTD